MNCSKRLTRVQKEVAVIFKWVQEMSEYKCGHVSIFQIKKDTNEKEVKTLINNGFGNLVSLFTQQSYFSN